jgi:hypothetical protein
MNPQDLSDNDLARWRILTEECERLENAARTAWDHVFAAYKQALAPGAYGKPDADVAVIQYQTAKALETAAEQALAAFVASHK